MLPHILRYSSNHWSDCFIPPLFFYKQNERFYFTILFPISSFWFLPFFFPKQKISVLLPPILSLSLSSIILLKSLKILMFSTIFFFGGESTDLYKTRGVNWLNFNVWMGANLIFWKSYCPFGWRDRKVGGYKIERE